MQQVLILTVAFYFSGLLRNGPLIWTGSMDTFLVSPPQKKKLIKEGEMNNKHDVKKQHLTPSRKTEKLTKENNGITLTMHNVCQCCT